MNNRSFLGQSAIEYLMTYGWMLLVVAITGGAIFATVGNQSTDSTSGFSGSDVLVDDFGVTSDDELGLNARNGAGNEIVVSRVNVSDSESGEYVYKEFTGDNRVGVGSEKVFELPNVTRADGSNSLDVEIIYDSGGLSNLSVSGTVSGDLELTGSGSYEGLPEDDHQSINDGGNGGEGGGSLSLMQTVNYTYDDSGDVQVNESTAGSDGYQVDLTSSNEKFSDDVQEIEIVEMHGADGTEKGSEGGSGGLITDATAEVSGHNIIDIWVGETSGSSQGGWGRSGGGAGADGTGGGGGGSTEIWSGTDNFVAASDAGGGSLVVSGNGYGGGGGARGGSGGTSTVNGNPAEGSGNGGDGGSGGSVGNGGQEINNSLVVDSGTTSTGGSSDGSGWILLEYYG